MFCMTENNLLFRILRLQKMAHRIIIMKEIFLDSPVIESFNCKWRTQVKHSRKGKRGKYKWKYFGHLVREAVRQKEAEGRQRPSNTSQSQCYAPCTDFFHGGGSSQDSSRKQVLVSGSLLRVVTQSNRSDIFACTRKERSWMLGCHALPGLQVSTTECFVVDQQPGFGCSSKAREEWFS